MNDDTEQFVDKIGMTRLTTISPRTAHRLEASGEFHRRFKISPNRVAWKLSEIEEWIECRPRYQRR